ncbi:MAG: hypothetical protein NTW32_19635 [Chloroflexi bacterium]|nr:hypothetical protein [Chloroflexota bacterium]
MLDWRRDQRISRKINLPIYSPVLNDADTCRTSILPKLNIANWDDDYILEQYVLTPGRIVPLGGQRTRKEGLCPDYGLFIRHSLPIAVVEAKAVYKNMLSSHR